MINRGIQDIYRILERWPWLKFWLLLGILLVVLLLFTKHVIIFLFIVLNGITALGYKLFNNRSIAIEFITLSTFVMLYSYGFWTALLVLEISVFLHMIISMTFTPNMMLSVPISAFLLLLVLPFKPLGITTAGMIFTIGINIVLTIIVILFGTGRIHRRLIFFATHVVFNWFLFKNVAPELIRIMG